MIKRRSTGMLAALFCVLGLLWVLAAVSQAPVVPLPQTILLEHSVDHGLHTYAGVLASHGCPLTVSISAVGAAPRFELSLSEDTSDCRGNAPEQFSVSIAAAAPVLGGVMLDGSPVPVRIVNH